MTTTRRSFLKTTAAAGAVAALGAPFLSNPAYAKGVSLKLHQFLPPQALIPKQILFPWADKIEAASNGELKIERFSAMQLGGKPPQLMDQAVDGVADIVMTLPGYTPGRFPRVEVFELPFTMTNAEAVSRAYWQLGEEEIIEKDFAAVKTLGLWVHGPGVIHSKKPITQVSDLNGVKLRAPTRVTNQLFKSLGATPVGMPVPAVPQALSKGVIDATVIPWEVTSSLKIPELVGNHTEFGSDPLYTAAFCMVMNKSSWSNLPADLQKVMDDNSGLEFSANAGKIMAAGDAPARKLAVERGNNIITLDDGQVASWKKATASVATTWEQEIRRRRVDGAALRARAAELIANNSA